jgi:Ca-activated chloride channel family protein
MKQIKQITMNTLLVTAILLLPEFCFSQQNPIAPAYTSQELKKIRKWEKKWVGKRIDQSNIEQVSEFLPASQVEIYKNPEKWGAPPEGLYFTIAAYVPILETTGMIKATNKYAPQVKTDAAGDLLNSDEIAGFPFPSPIDGKQIAYNIAFQNNGDAYRLRRQTHIIDPAVQVDKLIEYDDTYLSFIRRTELDQRPVIGRNPKGFAQARKVVMLQPPEFKYSRLIQMQPIDETKKDIVYFWYNQFRRIRRFANADWTRELYRSDIYYEDDTMWDNRFSSNTYTLKGKKEMLLARHQDINKIKRIKGQVIPNGLYFERCNVYVVEVVNKDPNYPYEKRIWYVDPETFRIHWQEVYGEQGRLLKSLCQPTQNITTEIGETKNFMVANFVQDFKENIGAVSLMKDIKISTAISPREFTISNLSGTYGGSSLYSNSAGRHSGVKKLSIGIDTEVWVIEKSSVTSESGKKVESPQLRAKLPDEKKEVPLPLEHTDVQVHISGYIASVDVLQKYHNPYKTKIEAVYVFPLPQSAAVTDFIMIIGDRKIRGIIREKDEAKKIYEEAKRQGYRASLMTQERPNIFEQKVANIEPGKRIDISISFFNPLQYKDGEFEFVFPTIVGPRFNPPGHSGGIGATSRENSGSSGQAVEVQYLNPDEKSGHDIDITVNIDAGVSIEKIYSDSHVIRVDKKDKSHATITLSPHDTVPNKDFVLRYRTAGNKVKTAMMVHKDEKENYFSLLLQPPVDIENLPRMPREMVFVLDCSGSMRGRPLAKAKEAVRRCLRNLDEKDTFQIIRFSANASALGPNPIPATLVNVEKGLEYLESLTSGGGTMMIEGIKAALNFPHEEGRMRIVSFMTDGLIGNETEILSAIKKRLGASRIFSFGVGSSVNRYLMEQMAIVGRGAVAYVGLDESAGEKVDIFFKRASRPALADIEIDWGDLKVVDVYPKKLTDLFVGRPVTITGRLLNVEPTTIKLTGRVGTKKKAIIFSVKAADYEASHPGIRSIWARWKLADLALREIDNPSEELRTEIIKTSTFYNLLSKYTAFLAVDSSGPTSGNVGYKVNVPVPVPYGVKYETTVE